MTVSLEAVAHHAEQKEPLEVISTTKARDACRFFYIHNMTFQRNENLNWSYFQIYQNVQRRKIIRQNHKKIAKKGKDQGKIFIK